MNKPHSSWSVSAWVAQHGAAWRSGWIRVFQRPFSSILSISVMAIALALPLALAWSMLQLQQLSGSVQSAQTVSVFFKPEITLEQASQISRVLQNDPAVAQIQIKSPQQGLQEFQHSSELAQAVSMLDSNPLPVVLLIEPKTDDRALIAHLQTLPQVEQVQFDASWRNRLQAWLALGRQILSLLAVLFVSGGLLAVANNVRLDIATREHELAVLQQLGATDAYIRRPFLYLGALLGLCSGGFALLILLAADRLIRPSVGTLISSYGSSFHFAVLDAYVPIAVAAVSMVLGVIGARLACGHHLRITRTVDL